MSETQSQPKFPPPNPPPPRTDLPKPEALSDEDYALLIDEMRQSGPVVWRDTDGTIYSYWMPADMAPALGGPADSSVGLAPGDPNYGRFVNQLLEEFDYQGVEVPSGQGPDSDANAG